MPAIDVFGGDEIAVPTADVGCPPQPLDVGRSVAPWYLPSNRVKGIYVDGNSRRNRTRYWILGD